MLTYPLFGSLSNRLGRKPLYLFGLVAMAPAAGVTGALFSMSFDADVRYSGVSIGYTLSQVIGSAFAPTIAAAIAAALYAATGTSNAIAGYLIVVAVISAVAVLPTEPMETTGSPRGT